MSKWTVFSNHGHVLLFLSNDPEARLRDVATSVGITERAVQKIVRDLQDGGMVSVSKHGRRNRYQINSAAALRHSLEAHCTIGQLIELIEQTRPVPEFTATDLPIEKPEKKPESIAVSPEKSPVEIPEQADKKRTGSPDSEQNKSGKVKRKTQASSKSSKPATRKPRGEQGSLF